MARDIAMLKLRKPAQINRAVNLACLPGSSGRVSDGKMCWVTGNKTVILNDYTCMCKNIYNHVIMYL